MIEWALGGLVLAAGATWAALERRRQGQRRTRGATSSMSRVASHERPATSRLGVWVVTDDAGWADQAEVCVGWGRRWKEADGRETLALHQATFSRPPGQLSQIVVAFESPQTSPNSPTMGEPGGVRRRPEKVPENGPANEPENEPANVRQHLMVLVPVALSGHHLQAPTRVELPAHPMWGAGGIQVVHRKTRVLAGVTEDVWGEVDSVLPPSLASATISSFEGQTSEAECVRALRIRAPSGRAWWYAGRLVLAEYFGRQGS